MNHDATNTDPRASLVAADGAVSLPALRLPFSAYASEPARRLFVHDFAEGAAPRDTDLLGLRAFYDRFNDRLLERVRARFPAEAEEDSIGGVRVLRVRRAGAKPDPTAPLVLNLHGGGFAWGEDSGALVESFPLACLGGAEVIAVQYRLSPEHRHPAAAEDIVAVYTELLKQRPAASIGLFGCSAGAVLASQALALLHARSTALPGALALFSGAGLDIDGDSAWLAPPACGEAQIGAGGTPIRMASLPYFASAAAGDPLLFPAHSEALLRAFPPTLLLCGSRDFYASSVSLFQRKLLAAGVPARLVLFDGMAHAFHIYPELDESLEANTLLARFFDELLVRA